MEKKPTINSPVERLHNIYLKNLKPAMILSI